jgi:hypothetical protein
MRKMRIARADPGMRTTYIAKDPSRDRPGMIAGKMKIIRRRQLLDKRNRPAHEGNGIEEDDAHDVKTKTYQSYLNGLFFIPLCSQCSQKTCWCLC